MKFIITTLIMLASMTCAAQIYNRYELSDDISTNYYDHTIVVSTSADTIRIVGPTYRYIFIHLWRNMYRVLSTHGFVRRSISFIKQADTLHITQFYGDFFLHMKFY